MRAVAVAVFICVASVLTGGCAQGPISPASPSALAPAADGQSIRNENACWGEASEALARLGEMGVHASGPAGSPRLGLRNVARMLYEDGVLTDDSLQALGAFLSSLLGLSIDSCL